MASLDWTGQVGVGIRHSALARQSIAQKICSGKLRGPVSYERAWSEYEW